ncbi:MAG: hypothetical protein A3G87_03600 [Omnitrophica bacterium RIFCSPLOWO2_12_FULL_50_11]|nr:MAG: hypothetical protein A3G87_03600 [Omnitrophica bacterium RIFCSPLOWO2_12_FULL_50_11]
MPKDLGRDPSWNFALVCCSTQDDDCVDLYRCMHKTFRYQNRIIFIFAVILFLVVTGVYLRKKVDHFGYAELIKRS